MLVKLYIKTHLISGMKYFGKTIQDPYKYRGSGLKWKEHIKKFGDYIHTFVVGEYSDDDPKLYQDAVEFSKANNIVNDPLWMNEKIESGYGGGFSAWSTKLIYQVSKSVKTKKEFREKYPAAVARARLLGIWEDVSKNIPSAPTSKIKWTRESIFNEAKKYHSKGEFHEKSSSAVTRAKKSGIWEELVLEMGWKDKRGNKPKWNYNSLILEANKYNTHENFRTLSGGAYATARKMGIIEEITKNYKPKYYGRKIWNKKY